MDFQSFSKSHLLFEIWFYPKVLETFFLLQIGPWFTNKALDRLGTLQCGPRGMAGGGSLEFRRSANGAARMAHIPKRQARRGPAARVSRQWGRVCTEAEAARRAVQAKLAGRLAQRDRPVFQPVNPTLTVRFFKTLNCATKTVDTKVVDETSLYNICKGCPMIFSTV
jgi:hypothetical protein